MKTPMQELIDMIERKSYLTKDDIIFEANKLLEKERQMVIDAFIKGNRNCGYTGIIDAEQYYNETFKTK